jgi:hypothetical protein
MFLEPLDCVVNPLVLVLSSFLHSINIAFKTRHFSGVHTGLNVRVSIFLMIRVANAWVFINKF